MPTFAHLAGIEINTPNIDGLNIWNALSMDTDHSPRNEVLGQLDLFNPPHSAYIYGKWKYINGTTYNGTADNWLGHLSETETHESMNKYGKMIRESMAAQAFNKFSYSLLENNLELSVSEINNLRNEAQIKCPKMSFEPKDQYVCKPLEAPCLFNLHNDPCERYNLAKVSPEIVHEMEERLERFRRVAVPMQNLPRDERSNPTNFNNTWTWWYDELCLNDDGTNSGIGWLAVAAGSTSLLITCCYLTVCGSAFKTFLVRIVGVREYFKRKQN